MREVLENIKMSETKAYKYKLNMQKQEKDEKEMFALAVLTLVNLKSASKEVIDVSTNQERKEIEFVARQESVYDTFFYKTSNWTLASKDVIYILEDVTFEQGRSSHLNNKNKTYYLVGQRLDVD